MKTVPEIAQKESERIFWVIQTIFAFIIGRSFYTYGTVFIPPFNYDIITLSLALLAVYTCVLWSWIDFSFTTIVAPYHFKKKPLEKFRFVSDLFIVLLYTYLLIYLEVIREHPSNRITGFFIAFCAIYFGYALSGLLRIVEYGRRASRIGLIVSFMGIFSLNMLLYIWISEKTDNTEINRFFISSSFVLTCAYRIVRSKVSKRKHTIAVDVDGVLSNQISGILPLIRDKYNKDLRYEDITDWRLPIKDTSIDKIIVSEQDKKSYVIGMPMHSGASQVIKKLIKKYYIAIATSRSADSDHWTKEWMAKNNISYDSYHNLKEGGKQNAKENFDILIDDYIGNIKAFLEQQEGKAILFSQPWNTDARELEGYIKENRLLIVSSWSDIPESVEKLLKN